MSEMDRLTDEALERLAAFQQDGKFEYEPNENYASRKGSPIQGHVIRYNPNPRKNSDGSTSHGLNFPALVASDLLGKADKTMAEVAEQLNACPALARELLAYRRAPVHPNWGKSMPSPAAPATPARDDLRERQPDYCFNPEDWEYTQPWDARHELAESILDYGRDKTLARVSTLISGPDKWVARIPLDTDGDGEADDWELQWFDSEERARAALRDAGGTDGN